MKIRSIVFLLLAFILTACVHEFPDERPNLVPFRLHLDFNDEMSLYKEVVYTKTGETKGPGAHDIRYTVNAYRTDVPRAENRIPDATFIFTESEPESLNYTASLELQEGDYNFSVWADYVDSGTREDKYYDTHDFSEIILADRDNHSGSNDFRDAFRGYASATVIDPALYTGEMLESIDNQATAEMMRPMGKFKFVSTDLAVFLRRAAQMMQERGLLSMNADIQPDTKAEYDKLLQSVDLEQFTVRFRYNAFMPCSFNMFTDKPSDSWTGMTFTSNMYTENNEDMTLGYDYVFVNGSETTLSVSVEVYDSRGELMSSSRPIDVPVVRSKLTVVKGEFLSSKATGGVTINPGYDGEDYNIEIY